MMISTKKSIQRKGLHLKQKTKRMDEEEPVRRSSFLSHRKNKSSGNTNKANKHIKRIRRDNKKRRKGSEGGKKIVISGSGGVGKSCLVLRYLFDKFVEEYDPTIEETYCSKMKVDGKKIPIELIDTAGQEEFRSFLDATLSFGEAFVVVFAITDRESYDEAKYILERVERMFVEERLQPIVCRQ
eukprot:m.158281 g.158281  ORF g.158281 m.158281 type:complete len:184 (+) comp13351_c6_seq2:2950-3501(+)